MPTYRCTSCHEGVAENAIVLMHNKIPEARLCPECAEFHKVVCQCCGCLLEAGESGNFQAEERTETGAEIFCDHCHQLHAS